MAHWEYKTESYAAYSYSVGQEEGILMDASLDGWELVQIRDANYDSQSVVIFTFKRLANMENGQVGANIDETSSLQESPTQNKKRERFKTFR